MSRLPQYPSKPNHASGQARIRLGKKTIYLGKWGSPESIQKFHALLAEHLGQPDEPAAPDPYSTTIATLLAKHHDWAVKRFVKNGVPTREADSRKSALRPVFQFYGDCLTKDFGPLAFQKCREWMFTQDWSRSTINQQMGRIRAVFKWGIAQEMVPASVLAGLQCVQDLRRGESPARETTRVLPVPEEWIERTVEAANPAIATMIRLQLHTGMRPGEVVLMRTCDIDRNSSALPESLRSTCWVYTPRTHKTEHRGRSRIILIGPKAQSLLEPWLRPHEPDAHLFQPAETMRRLWRTRAERAGKEPAVRSGPQAMYHDHYSAHTYTTGVGTAAVKAGVPRWHANRLRHNAATRMRAEFGLEVARTILGHTTSATTLIYAELDLERAANAIIKSG